VCLRNDASCVTRWHVLARLRSSRCCCCGSLVCDAGVNTGPCITGDVDCDGDPGGTDPTIAYEGADAPDLSTSEFAVIVFDFGFNNSAGGFRPNITSGSSVNGDVARGFNPGFHGVVGDSGACLCLCLSVAHCGTRVRVWLTCVVPCHPCLRHVALSCAPPTPLSER
jgi:hypothetical protein